MVEVVRGMRIYCGEPDCDLEGGSEFKSGGIIGAAQGAEYKGYVGYAKNRGGMGIGDQRMAWLRVSRVVRCWSSACRVVRWST